MSAQYRGASLLLMYVAAFAPPARVGGGFFHLAIRIAESPPPGFCVPTVCSHYSPAGV
jgi:hypothetical protein